MQNGARSSPGLIFASPPQFGSYTPDGAFESRMRFLAILQNAVYNKNNLLHKCWKGKINEQIYPPPLIENGPYFDRNMTDLLKGVALIFMFVHHLFTFPSWYIDSISYPELEAFAHIFCMPFKICAGTSYFAISNGMTEASENVWGTALPYLVPVDSSTDRTADNYLYTVQMTPEQLQPLLAGLNLAPDLSAPESWFGESSLTPSGYVAGITVCGQTVTGPALRKALGLRSACFTVGYQDGSFSFTTKGYGHGVGLSQWGARALAEQGQSAPQILAHYFPGTELRR